MTPHFSVPIGAIRAAKAPALLSSSGIGSCLVVVLYDPEAKIGGMAHTLLPSVPGQKQLHGHHYVEDSIDALVTELQMLGATKEKLWAKLIGGAHMFSLYDKDGTQNIGAQNIAAGRQKLRELGIPVYGEVLEGTVGRSVHFDLESGICTVETKM